MRLLPAACRKLKGAVMTGAASQAYKSSAAAADPPAAAGTSYGTTGSTAAAAAGGGSAEGVANSAGVLGTDVELLQLPGQSATWWEASGLDPSALLLKYQQQLVTSNTGLLNSSCGAAGSSTAPSSGDADSSRRGTRDVGVLGSKGTGKGSSHAHMGGGSKLSRPSSALPAKGTSSSSSRPASAAAAAAAGDGDGGAGSGSRRTTRSKAPTPPKSPQPPGSMSGGTASTAAAGSSASANTAAAAAAAGSGSLGVTDEELLARLLAASSAQQAAAVYACMGERHAASVLQKLADMPRGEAAVAALLGCLSPVVAVR
jgi:hypothetical protein